MRGYMITREAFRRLPEYSASLPTGTTPGKMWRRHDGAHDPVFIARGGAPKWQIGQYDPDDDGKGPTIKVFWYVPLFVIPGSAMVEGTIVEEAAA